MRHYTINEWQRYIESSLTVETTEEMEDHLYTCDECMANYLLLLEASDAIDVIVPPSDFTSNVLGQIDFDLRVSEGRTKEHKKTIIKYYVVAASITMLLMYSGFFDFFSQVPRATSEMVVTTRRIEELIPLGWSQQMLDSTFETLHSFTIKQGSDLNEN